MTNSRPGHPGHRAELPAIVLAVRHWNRILARQASAGPAIPIPIPVSGSGAADRPGTADWHRADAAAEQALLRYPGPVGLLVHDQIRAYQRPGERWPDILLVGRVIDELQAPAGNP